MQKPSPVLPETLVSSVSALKAPAKRVSGGRIASPVHRPHSTNDWMLERDVFNSLNAEYGPFTVDACADVNGFNAQVATKYFNTASSFLLATPLQLSGENVWCNPPFDDAAAFVEHYLYCKSKSTVPASAVFILPKWSNPPWALLTSHMDIVAEFPAHTQLFTRPEKPGSLKRVRVGPTPWPIQVYYDSAANQVPPGLLGNGSHEVSTPVSLYVLRYLALSRQRLKSLKSLRRPSLPSMLCALWLLVTIPNSCWCSKV
jgi:hypothetical protein